MILQKIKVSFCDTICYLYIILNNTIYKILNIRKIKLLDKKGGAMIDIQHSNERNFCGAITPKEKDKIMKAILDMAAHERKTFCFTPNDVPNLKINGKQFEMVIMDFFEKGYIIKENISQYWDCSDIYPTCKLYEIAQFGGFKAAYEIKKANIQKMSLELELMGKKLESDFPEEANKCIEFAQTIASLFVSLNSIIGMIDTTPE